MFSNFKRRLRRKDSKVIVSDERLGSDRVEDHKIKVYVKEPSDAVCEMGLCTLKFHFLDYVVEDSEQFGS